MGVISMILDAVVIIFSAVLAVAVPLFDSQNVLPSVHPAMLVEFNRWYIKQFDDYLSAEKPHFFVGLVWIELILLWPLSIANIYGIIARRPWAATTSLITGVSVTTSMTAIMSELLGSGRASAKLLQMYFPFAIFGLLSFVRGLLPTQRHAVAASSKASSARKKKA